jgi:hypothetical protein
MTKTDYTWYKGVIPRLKKRIGANERKIDASATERRTATTDIPVAWRDGANKRTAFASDALFLRRNGALLH